MAALLTMLVTVVLGWAGSATGQSPTTTTPDSSSASLGGVVTTDAGAPASGVDVDLFTGGRQTYLTSTATDQDGRYDFEGLDAGCYEITIIAPPSTTFANGSGFQTQAVCVEPGQVIGDVDAELIDLAGLSSLTAEVRQRFSGQPVGGVTVDLFTSDQSGNRIEYLRSGVTLPDGAGVEFTGLTPGCYTATFIAPDGASFNDGGGPTPWSNQTRCLDAGDAATATATIDGAVPTATVLPTIIDGSQNGVAGVAIDLFTAGGDGSRATYVTSEVTSGSGEAIFNVAAGCYVLVAIAPPDRLFTNGTGWAELPVCVAASDVTRLFATLA